VKPDTELKTPADGKKRLQFGAHLCPGAVDRSFLDRIEIFADSLIKKSRFGQNLEASCLTVRL
jgi:hypothetical protein